LIACIIAPSSDESKEIIPEDTQEILVDDTEQKIYEPANSSLERSTVATNINVEDETQSFTNTLEIEETELEEQGQEQMEKEEPELEKQEIKPLEKENSELPKQEKEALERKDAEEEKQEQEQFVPEQVEQENTNQQNSQDSYNFDTYDNVEQQNTTEQWVLNTNSKKIHYPSCKSVKKISPKNYSTSSLSLEELKIQGYTTCGQCF